MMRAAGSLHRVEVLSHSEEFHEEQKQHARIIHSENGFGGGEVYQLGLQGLGKTDIQPIANDKTQEIGRQIPSNSQSTVIQFRSLNTNITNNETHNNRSLANNGNANSANDKNRNMLSSERTSNLGNISKCENTNMHLYQMSNLSGCVQLRQQAISVENPNLTAGQKTRESRAKYLDEECESYSQDGNNPNCNKMSLWQFVRVLAGIVFALQQFMAWTNIILIFQYNPRLAWWLIGFSLVSNVVSILNWIQLARRHDYVLNLFPHNKVGVWFLSLSLLNLEFVYSQWYQAVHGENCDRLKVFNENNLQKKRLSLFFQSFLGAGVTAYFIVQDQPLEYHFHEFCLIYVIFCYIDFAFHLTFFSTDFFEDCITLLFNLVSICLIHSSDDDDDDDFSDEELDSQVIKYETHPLDQQTILFRKIPLSLSTFAKFLRDNLFFSLSFYHNFLDLSLRSFLLAISLTLTDLSKPSPKYVFQIEGLVIASIVVGVIIVGTVNCFCEVSKQYFEKSMILIVSCLQGVIIKLSRWNIYRVFEGMTKNQLFVLKFLPGLIRLVELGTVQAELIYNSPSLESYFWSHDVLMIYIHDFAVVYSLFLTIELLYEIFSIIRYNKNVSSNPLLPTTEQVNTQIKEQIISAEQQDQIIGDQTDKINNNQNSHKPYRKESGDSEAMRIASDEPPPKQIYLSAKAQLNLQIPESKAIRMRCASFDQLSKNRGDKETEDCAKTGSPNDYLRIQLITPPYSSNDFHNQASPRESGTHFQFSRFRQQDITVSNVPISKLQSTENIISINQISSNLHCREDEQMKKNQKQILSSRNKLPVTIREKETSITKQLESQIPAVLAIRKKNLKSFSISPTKVASVPATKVTELINKYSSFASQRKKKVNVSQKDKIGITQSDNLFQTNQKDNNVTAQTPSAKSNTKFQDDNIH